MVRMPKYSNSNNSFSSRRQLKMRGRGLNRKRKRSMEYNYSNKWLNSSKNHCLPNLIKGDEEEEVLSPTKLLNKINNSNKTEFLTTNSKISSIMYLKDLSHNISKIHHSLLLSTVLTHHPFNSLLLYINSKCQCTSSSSLMPILHTHNLLISTLLKWFHHSQSPSRYHKVKAILLEEIRKLSRHRSRGRKRKITEGSLKNK